MSNNKSIQNLITNKRVCIVGPANYLNNLNIGSEIDNYDTIIRFNKGYNLIKNPNIFGSRTDILYHCVSQDIDNGGPITEDMVKEYEIVFSYPFLTQSDNTSFQYGNTVEYKNLPKFISKMNIVKKDAYLKWENDIGCRPNTGIIAILDILDISKSIASKYISDFTFREHQLFFHNQQDLNCERHFRIFRQQNTISNKCFSCYKVIIKLFDVNDLIRLSFIFNNFDFLDNFEMKCRVDLENKIYRGYIYCSSIADLDLVTNKIKSLLLINFENNYQLETRRGCSEYLKIYPEFKNISNDPKKMFQYPENWAKNEELVDSQTYKNGLSIIRNAQKPLKGITLNYYLIMNNWINISKEMK